LARLTRKVWRAKLFLMNTTRRRIRIEKNKLGAESDLWELQYLCHSRRGPRYLKKVARRAERRLAKVDIHEALAGA
jgi:hypothetical protein